MELTINNLIKIIIGVIVIGVVVTFVALFFKNYVLDFFNNLIGEEVSEVFLSLLK
jgi:Na+-translocating ferredoxin:NAD+ oxidoreductase RnfE subunit